MEHCLADNGRRRDSSGRDSSGSLSSACNAYLLTPVSSLQRSKCRALSVSLLKDVCAKNAEQVNRKFAPEVLPLVSDRNSILSHPREDGKSPYFILPSSEHGPKNRKRLFSGEVHCEDFVPTSVDLTEPPFEDLDHMWSSRQLQVLTFEMSGLSEVSRSISRSTNDSVKLDFCSKSSNSNGDYPLEISEKSFRSCYDHSSSRASSFSMTHSSNSESYDVPTSHVSRREPNRVPDSAFKLFELQLSPLLRLPTSTVPRIAKRCWAGLSDNERSAFVMQRLLLCDEYKQELLNYLNLLPVLEKDLYINRNLPLLQHLFGDGFKFDIFNSDKLYSNVSPDSVYRNGNYTDDSSNLTHSDNMSTSTYNATAFDENAKEFDLIPLISPSKNSSAWHTCLHSPFCSTSKISWNFDGAMLKDVENGGPLDGRSCSPTSSQMSETAFAEINSSGDVTMRESSFEEQSSEVELDSIFDESNSSIVSVIHRPNVC